MSSSRILRCLLMPALGVALLPVPRAAAQGQDLLARCWPAAQTGAKPDERRPVRGAPGHAAAIPKVTLPAGAPLPASERGAIRRVELPKGQKLVALTLDLCEQPGEIAGYDGPIFDYLRRNNIKVTVFAGGKWLMTHGERAEQLIADPLIEVGNHGWAHRNVRVLDAATLQSEILGPMAAYTRRRNDLLDRECAKAAPQLAMSRAPRMSLYRFPFGACNAAALDALAVQGLKAIQWDVSTGDSTPTETADRVARTIVQGTRPGSIILAHANGRGHHTAAALAIAIPQLLQKGYRFVTVSELLAAGRPVITPTCYDSRPGDTDKYDLLFRRPQAAVPPRSEPRP